MKPILFLAVMIILLLVIACSAAAVPYPIVAVRAPRLPDKFTSWQEVAFPTGGEPGSHLVIIKPDGTEEILVHAGADGMCMDPCVSLDGKTVYYAFVSNQRAKVGNIHPQVTLTGADIYKIDLATREKTRLTHQEWTPALGVAQWMGEPNNLNHIGAGNNTPQGDSVLTYGIYNTGPCEVPGGKLVFTSSRNGYKAPKGQSFPGLQLYSMDTDGKNVEQIGYLNIGSALHPVLLKSGEIAWSSWECQGMRAGLLWGIWTSRPDGTEWNPAFSAFGKINSAHFATQQPDGKIVTCMYYNLNNFGFGTFFRFPHKPEPPMDLHAFHSPIWFENPVMRRAYANGFTNSPGDAYSPWGIECPTAFCNEQDMAASPHSAAGPDRWGKVTHPAAGPDGLLMVYSPGPVNASLPPGLPPPHGKIAWLAYDKTIDHPSGLTIIKEDPAFNYQQPRALLSWKQVMKSDPVVLPWNPNDGKTHPKLPKGTPFGIVGTSSVYNRNSTGNGSTQDQMHGLERQGGDIGVYKNSDIHAIRIVQQSAQSHRGWTVPTGPHQSTVGWSQAGPAHLVPNERMKILGEIPLRKVDANGDPILDAKGDPDTSFQARVPADIPFTFQIIDKKGQTLVNSQTWHQLRPGERRVNCGGCHAHAESPVNFDFTEAAKDSYVIKDFFDKPKDREWHRDAKPIVEAECKVCHTTNATAKAKMDLTDTLAGFVSKTLVIQARVSPTIAAAEGGVPHTAIDPAKVRVLAEWIDLGMGVDSGKYFQDQTNPTLSVASPTKYEAADVIVFGAFDNESGLDTVTATLDGQTLTAGQPTNSVYTIDLPTAKKTGLLKIVAKDKQGNIATVNRSFNGDAVPPPIEPPIEPPVEPPVDPDCTELEAQIAALNAQLERIRAKAAATTEAAKATESEAAPLPPPQPLPPAAAGAQYIGRDADKLGDLRSKVPDGKLDHHIRLTGLTKPVHNINVMDGATKWSNMAGEESPTNPQGTWWWVKTEPPIPSIITDIYISDRGTAGNFVVYPIYADNSSDRLPAVKP